MRKLWKSAVVFYALGLLGSASAADLPRKAPAPVAVPAAPTWTGWYVGINGGGVWGNTDPSLVVSPNGYFIPGNDLAVSSVGSQSFNHTGGLFGGHVGYLQQWGSIVGGLELGIDWTGLDSSHTGGALYPIQGCGQAAGCAFSITTNVKSDWLLTFLGRLGVNMGAWFPYVTGGLASDACKRAWSAR